MLELAGNSWLLLRVYPGGAAGLRVPHAGDDNCRARLWRPTVRSVSGRLAVLPSSLLQRRGSTTRRKLAARLADGRTVLRFRTNLGLPGGRRGSDRRRLPPGAQKFRVRSAVFLLLVRLAVLRLLEVTLRRFASGSTCFDPDPPKPRFLLSRRNALRAARREAALAPGALSLRRVVAAPLMLRQGERGGWLRGRGPS